MAALTQDRNTPLAEGDLRVGGAGAAELLYAGAMLMRGADGYLVEGKTATGLIGVGRCEKRVDNSDGSDGDLDVTYRPGVFRFGNSASTDEITVTEIGKLCYAVDDQTVAATDGTASRSPAGFVDSIDDHGVWVRFDEALVRTYVDGVAEPSA